ncbi:MAG: bifunctional hydroxymethylpyrimidine kinase/phosphomethylpyrimidine kinase [Micropruina sp.]|uniref:bifunctional hydroxymethylpyrimidine kinase/phosphomethylpyrimidine kinase n=1 Tax=Micropruina sp. TaxID=2737536 RepID=UPI0039E70D11
MSVDRTDLDAAEFGSTGFGSTGFDRAGFDRTDLDAARFDTTVLAVYLVTDAGQCAAAGRSVADTVAAAVRSGVRSVQVRAKDASGATFLDDVAAVADAIASVPGADCVLIVNDRVDVALAARARGVPVDGVHVGQSDLPAPVLRAILWPGAILGVSAATREEIRAAEPYADYLGIGPLRDTATKPDADPALGLARVAELAATRLPAVTIGGVLADDLPGLRAAGLDGAAVVSGICAAPDPGEAARTYLARWNTEGRTDASLVEPVETPPATGFDKLNQRDDAGINASRGDGMIRSVPNVLSIAGTDPTGGAGIQADLKAIGACGGYGMAVVTALVAQNTTGVREVHYPDTGFLRAQLDAVSDDVAIDAVKLGMLGTVEVIATVRDWLERVRPTAVVLDPVMVATSGDRLLDAAAEAAMRELARLADVLTPNVPELAVLAGVEPASTWSQTLDQAQRVAAATGALVVAKGGHLDDATVSDALVGPDGLLAQVEHPRLATRNTHGTGCSLSSALATRHAVTGDWALALAESSDWLAASIARGDDLDVGRGNGPVHHVGPLWEAAGGPLPGPITDWWWQQASGIRDAIAELPFVRALGDGTLPTEAFTWYLAQDALYLGRYAQSLAAASRMATDEAERAFWHECSTSAIATELQLHESWVAPEVVAQTRPSPVTTAYLDHFADAEATGDYAVLTAALLPCFWIYAEVGDALAARNRPGHPYADWLATYSDEAFAESTRRAIAITETAARRAGAGSRMAAARAFRAACVHEREFFAAPLS